MILGQQGIEVKGYFILFPTKVLNNPKNESSLKRPTMKGLKKRGQTRKNRKKIET